MRLPSLAELKISSRRVLVRTGFDVPLRDGRLAFDFPLRDILPTVDYLTKRRAKVLILSHLGQPGAPGEALTLEPVVRRLAELLNRKFVVISPELRKLPEYDIPHLYFFKHNLETDDAASLVGQMRDRDVAVLENLRLYEGEVKNQPGFAKKLASLGEVYVNEAFAESHRVYASIVSLPAHMPAAAGLTFLKEYNVLTRASLRKPLAVMLGGQVSFQKLQALKLLAKAADLILLGGVVATLFLRMRDFEVGKSLDGYPSFGRGRSPEERLARELWRDHKQQIKLPIDAVVSSSPQGLPDCVKVNAVKPSQMILDIGPETIRQFSGFLKQGQTLIWSGPLGCVENPAYAHGSSALAWLFASRASNAVFAAAGGSKTLEILENLDVRHYLSYVSAGSIPMLLLLAGPDGAVGAGGSLPGLEALCHDQI